MPQRSSLKKLVVELRYKPELGFYGRMDPLGLKLSDEFPDWERTPLTLEVRNKKKHHRIFMSATRTFFEGDEADPDTTIPKAQKLLKQVAVSLEVKAFSRVGVRQWFVADQDKTFAQMVDEFSDRFLAHNATVQSIFTDKTKDIAYVADYITDEGWRYNLRMGPMIKSQWFSIVAYDPGNFEHREDGETLEKHLKTFSEQFLYIDIDCYQEDQPVDKLDLFLDSVRRRSNDLATKLIEYCRK